MISGFFVFHERRMQTCPTASDIEPDKLVALYLAVNYDTFFRKRIHCKTQSVEAPTVVLHMNEIRFSCRHRLNLPMAQVFTGP